MRRELLFKPLCIGVTIMCFMGGQIAFAQDVSVPAGQEQSLPATKASSTQDASEFSTNVTLDFKDADILLVLRLLSLKSGVNIVAGPEVTGTVTIRLNDVPWEKALDVVLRTYGYVYERDQNIIRVTTRDQLAAEELVTDTFVLNYSTAAEIEEAIGEIISERGRIKSVTRTNTVIVTDVATNIYKIGEIIKRLDKRTPQVYIDSTIVLTEQQNIANLGIAYSDDAGTLTGAGDRETSFPWVVNPERQGRDFFRKFLYDNDENGSYATGTLDFSSFTATLNLLKSYSSTKVVSNPRIVVLSNQTAKVQVGKEIGIPTFERNESTGSFEVTGYEERDVGVVLNVTPHVNDANEILVELHPEVSSFGGFKAVNATLSYPEFTTTEADTQVLIKDGETIAIGGLIEDKEEITKKKLPLLGDIPIIGRAFRSQRQTSDPNAQKETLFFITCTIVDTEGQPEFTDFL